MRRQQPKRFYGRLVRSDWFLIVAIVAFVLAPARIADPAIIEVSGACTLAGAIDNANADADTTGGQCLPGSGPDEVQLTADVSLATIDNSTDGPNALPSITTQVTLEGGGFTVSRSGLSPTMRLLQVAASGVLDLNDVVLDNGLATDKGGAIFNRGTTTLTSSTVSGSEVSADDIVYGGGIYNASGAYLYLVSSTVSGNTADGEVSYGGAIYNRGTVDLMDSTISGNSAYAAGGFAAASGGGIASMAGAVTITSSTISGNIATGEAGYGGGINMSSGTLGLTNSTVSGNSVVGVGGSSYGYGGGMRVASGTTLVYSSTIAGNSTSATFAYAGGAHVDPAGTLDFSDSLVAASTGDNCSGAVGDVEDNLSDDATCGTIPDTLTGLDAALADNGGPTLTHALQSGSSAIDAAGICTVTVDQRGAPRDAKACDVGAYEVSCSAPDGSTFTLENDTIDAEETFEVCNLLIVGPNLMVVGPSGHLILRSGSAVELRNGFEIGPDGELTVEIDPSLSF